MMRPQISSLSPCLVVSDLARSVAFYREKLGFGEPTYWGDPPTFALMSRDDFDLMLIVAASPDRIHPNGTNGTWDFYLIVENAEAEAEALRAAGTELDYDPYERDYDMMELEVVDPDGYRICIGSPIE